MKTYLSHNATKQLIITLLLDEKPDSRPSNSEVIYLIFLAPKLGISMQTQRSRASWLVHGQYCKGALPSSCWQGASPGPAASAPTPLPHRAFLTSTQPSTGSPGPAPICLSQVYPLDGRGNTRWDSLLWGRRGSRDVLPLDHGHAPTVPGRRHRPKTPSPQG